MTEPADGDIFADAAGDPGEAADLPATTGRDPENGVPDRPYFAEGGVVEAPAGGAA